MEKHYYEQIHIKNNTLFKKILLNEYLVKTFNPNE